MSKRLGSLGLFLALATNVPKLMKPSNALVRYVTLYYALARVPGVTASFS